MRALGAAYTTALNQPVARSCWRILLANHGGAFADPLDITDHVSQLEITRPLRDGNSATILLHSETAQYDPINGVYAVAVHTVNAEVRIELGEVLDGVPTYWRVLTGQIVSNRPLYGTPVQTVELEVIDRAVNPWQRQYTSPNYPYVWAATPVGWTAHEIIRDLFERFAGFTWPGDFNLDPASDWLLPHNAQFLQMSLCASASAAIQPKGYRLYFDYYGRVASALLVPTGAPGTWAVALTIPEENIGSPGIDGPIDREPMSTRIQVIGGTADYDMAAISSEDIWATVRVSAELAAGPRGASLMVLDGDVREYVWTPNPPAGPATLQVWVEGSKGRDYRVGASEVIEARFAFGDATMFAVAPALVAGTEEYRVLIERQWARIDMQFNLYGLPYPNLDFEFDVGGHHAELLRPQVYTQAWNDALIAIWGESARSVGAPCVFNWLDGELVASQEQTIGSLSRTEARVPLGRLDLRPEPGDVLTIENPRIANLQLWVVRVSHACSHLQSKTRLEGYVIL